MTAPAPISSDSVALVLAALIWAIGALLVATMLADRRGLLPRSAVAFGRWSATLAGGLSLGAAAIHFAVIGEHFAEYPPYGVAFAALAWFQVAWAVAYLFERNRWIALAAILVNAGTLVVWADSRLVGLPVGPQPGELEPVGPLDLAAGAMELALIGLLAWDLRVRAIRLRPSLPPAAATMVLGSCAIAIVLLTSAAFALAGGNPEDDAAHEATNTPDLAVGSPTASSAPAPAGPATPLAAVAPGTIRFGTALDLAGKIATPADRFAPGETAVWIAEFSDAPDVPEIRLLIVQILPDGREFEHWRQEIALDDPGARRLVAGADLSIYVHGGEGSYRMRYLRGDELLAEGVFEFTP
jgi:hypothetical protein